MRSSRMTKATATSGRPVPEYCCFQVLAERARETLQLPGALAFAATRTLVKLREAPEYTLQVAPYVYPGVGAALDSVFIQTRDRP